GELLPLSGLAGVRRLVHGRPDLDRDRLESPPDHRERHRIHGDTSTMSVPSSPPRPPQPGGSTVVDSRSSMMAGPWSSAPAKRRSRSEIGVSTYPPFSGKYAGRRLMRAAAIQPRPSDPGSARRRPGPAGGTDRVAP